MTGLQFVDDLDFTLSTILSLRDAALRRIANSAGRADMPALLRGALRNELEASEIAALWVPSTPELEAKLAFARQAGDEARHYSLIEDRLAELGVEPGGVSPVADDRSKLYRYLETLETTVERVAAAQFAREAIGYKANELFIKFCEAAGDQVTARMYRLSIQPDEKHHHEWGKKLLARLAVTPEQQAAARKAILTTIELAEEIRSIAAGRLLVEALPGC